MDEAHLSMGVTLLKDRVPAEGTLSEKARAVMLATQEPNLLFFLYDNTGDDAFRCACAALFFGNHAPRHCHGSHTALTEWKALGGLRGIRDDAVEEGSP
jgi:hypothetical protein